jgi:hypothetical protein
MLGMVTGTALIVAPLALLGTVAIAAMFRRRVATLMRATASSVIDEVHAGEDDEHRTLHAQSAQSSQPVSQQRWEGALADRVSRRIGGATLAQAMAALVFGTAASALLLVFSGRWSATESISIRGLLGVLLIFSTPLPLGLVLVRSRSQPAMVVATVVWLLLIGVVSGDWSNALFIWNTWAAVPTVLTVLFAARSVRAGGPTMVAGCWLLLMALQLGLYMSSTAAAKELGIHFVDPELAPLPFLEAAPRWFEKHAGAPIVRLLSDYREQQFVRVAHPERATLAYAIWFTARCAWPMVVAVLLVWALFAWQAKRYRERRTSDVRLALDTMYISFVLTFASLFVGLLHRSTASWAVASGAFVYSTYVVSYSLGLRLLSLQADDAPPLGLLMLRTFGRDSRTQQLIDALSVRWRQIGPVQLIGGTDSVHATLAPHDFYDFISGRLARRFLSSQVDIGMLPATQHAKRDPDGLFRVESYYCGASRWQDAVERLMDGSAAVLMDLRGFTAFNKGCLFELTALIQRPRVRALLLVDALTDMADLKAAMLGAADASADTEIRERATSIATVCVNGSTRKTVEAICSRLLP